jgi:TolB-like protein/Flp pilus assembly protein TadD
MIGRRIGWYEVTAKLGEGGMGEVFRATDTRLGRAVALKVLPADTARDPDRLARFQREARAIAALNHPHIVTIHSIEEADGTHFLTMELVQGQPLSELIPADGLAVDRVVTTGIALADALAAAHDKGIVHRDLKPANVMVTPDGTVKVLDFGLAKEVRPSGTGDATMTSAGYTEYGIVMGTPAYMSPEQIAGRSVDHRTDIFSLGILLYQITGGQRPFDGASSIELASSILRDTHKPLGEVRRDVPTALVQLIDRCLEKDPLRRVQSARDVARELRDIARDAASGPPSRGSRPGSVGTARTDEGFWIAVQPFKSTSANVEITALAEGLSEEIVTGLSRFSYLKVIARRAMPQASSGARFLIDGSIRLSGSVLRVSAQLLDATTGAHLWAETYERPFQPDQIFALQDDLIPRIVSTCADRFGVLARSICDAARARDASQLSPYEALMRGFGYHHRLSPVDHADARDVLERAVEQAPAHADCWAMLSWIYSHEVGHGFNPRPGALDRALAAAQRAVELAPSNHLAYQALAVARFFRKETSACLGAAERALALNPLDASNEAMFLIAFTGDWERGCRLIRTAMDLNPQHPGWYRVVLALNEYRNGNYRDAVKETVAANAPGVFWTNVMLAAAHAQLGELDAARSALQALLAQKPDLVASGRGMLETWYGADVATHVVDGLLKAGLGTGSSPVTAAAQRIDEGFWIAVLPLKHSGSNAELAALAEGLGEDIVTGLSRFSYLRVIARGSVAKHANTGADVRVFAGEIGARYVMEGSVRQAGSQLRVAMQLVDATTGAHLWAETYNRSFRPDGIFEVQDELVPRIVATVADGNGVLLRSMADALRSRDPGELTPYESVLRGWGYYSRISPDEHALVRAALERAAERAPGSADVWALLSFLVQDEYKHDFNTRPDPLGRALDAARRAVDLAPSNHLSHQALAAALFFRRDLDAFRQAAERSIALNPMDGNSVAFLGCLIAYAGDWTRGMALVDRATALNPHHPGWFWLPKFCHAYRERDYAAALDAAVKVNMPDYFFSHATMVAARGQLGGPEAAREALQHLLRLKPDVARTIRHEFSKWFVDRELVEHIVEGLRKAGLDVPAADGSGSSQSARIGTAAQKPPVQRSIAVLPFANLSADKEQDYFSDGLAEEILNLLAKIPGLKVISRTSSFAFRGKDQDVPTIAQALGVGHVLEGSVRKSGNRLRISAQLIQASDGARIWSERFDRDLADVFAIQDEIGQAISAALQMQLAPPVRPVALDAYQDYLKGQYFLERVTPDAILKARDCFERAAIADPTFAPAFSSLALQQFLMAAFGVKSAAETVPAVRSAAMQALAIDPHDGEAHSLLATVAATFDYDWELAEQHHRQALASNTVSGADRPRRFQISTNTLRHVLWYLGPKGRGDQAVAESRAALETDPLAPLLHYGLVYALNVARRYDDAVDSARRGLEIDATYHLLLGELSSAQLHLGALQEAIATLERYVDVAPWEPKSRGGLAWALHQLGASDAARQQGALLLDAHPRTLGAAMYHAATGETTAMFEALDEAYRLRDPYLLYVAHYPYFTTYRGDERYRALLSRMRLV